MSIYIPGMEVPKNCDCCDFMTVEGEYGEPTCPFGRIIRCASEMQPDCPLVPVPEHGRLVDADKLGIRDAEKQAYEAYLREKGEFFVEEPLLEYMRGRLEGLTDASGRVRFAPTIIPASKEGEP